jgi:ribonuclease-3
LTNTQTLYELAEELEIGQYIKLSRGEEDSGGRHNKSILADTFEAIIGGLYVDQGVEASRAFIHNTILAHLDDIIKNQGLKDSKSNLQEVLQEKYKVSPTYKIVKEEGPDHARIFTIQVLMNETVLGEGVGHSKQEAEKNAAKDALQSKELVIKDHKSSIRNH